MNVGIKKVVLNLFNSISKCLKSLVIHPSTSLFSIATIAQYMKESKKVQFFWVFVEAEWVKVLIFQITRREWW